MTDMSVCHTSDDCCVFSVFFVSMMQVQRFQVCLFVWNTVVVSNVSRFVSQILWLLGFGKKTWVLVSCCREIRKLGKIIRHLVMSGKHMWIGKMNCVVECMIVGLHWTALWFRCNRRKTSVSLMTENMEEVVVSPDELWSQSGWQSAAPGTVWSTVILSVQKQLQATIMREEPTIGTN